MTVRPKIEGLGLLILIAASASHASAEKPEFAGAYTLVGQTSDDEALEESLTGSLDLYVGWSRGAGKIEAYAEGNTSLKNNGVATRLPRSNADAGTALDPNRSGRFQLSELKYRHTWPGDNTITAGLLDPSAYLDVTRITNDENLQFLGASFVNNPTIEFPDYTLGVATELHVDDDRRRWNLVLAASNGIADNPNLSYSQLLNVTDDNKGVFAGAEMAWPSKRYLIRTGTWLNSAGHDTLDGLRTDATNYGLYAVVGASRRSLAANLRLGVANPDVSLADKFASISIQWDRDKRVFGLAAAHTKLSSEATLITTGYSLHFEGYVRFTLVRDCYLTASVQDLVNGGFDSLTMPVDKNVLVFSVRFHHLFISRH